MSFAFAGPAFCYSPRTCVSVAAIHHTLYWNSRKSIADYGQVVNRCCVVSLLRRSRNWGYPTDSLRYIFVIAFLWHFWIFWFVRITIWDRHCHRKLKRWEGMKIDTVCNVKLEKSDRPHSTPLIREWDGINFNFSKVKVSVCQMITMRVEGVGCKNRRTVVVIVKYRDPVICLW